MLYDRMESMKMKKFLIDLSCFFNLFYLVCLLHVCGVFENIKFNSFNSLVYSFKGI